MMLSDTFSIWQSAFIVSAILSFLIGRPRLIIPAVLTFNFGVTFLYHDHIPTIMVLDVACASILMGRGARADFVALLYALMVPLYIPAILGGFSFGATYAIVEVIGYLQLAVIGGVGRGYVNRYFGHDYFPDGSLRPAQERGHHFIPNPPDNGKGRLDKEGRNLD